MTEAASLVAGATLLLVSAGMLVTCLRMRSPIAFILATNIFAWGILILFTFALSPPHLVRPWTTWTWLVGLLVASTACWWAAGRPVPPLVGLRSSARDALGDRVVALLAALAALSVVYATALAVGTPENEGDALTYHLPRAAFWYQRGGLGYIEHAVDPRLNAAPPNAEIGDLFTMQLSGSQRFVGLVQLAALVSLGVATAGIARRFGIGHARAALSGLVVMTFPVVITQAWTGMNDIVVASFLATAVFFLLGSSVRDLLLGGLATGLAIGTKPTAPLALPLLLIVVLVPARGRRVAKIEAVAGGVVAGSAWYVLNLIETGKPLGKQIQDAGHSPGSLAAVLETLMRWTLNVLDLSGSEGKAWFSYWIVGILMVAFGLLYRGRTMESIAPGLIVLAAPILVSVTYTLLRAAVLPAFVPADLNTLASGASSWYGPLGAIGLVAGIALAVKLGRERRDAYTTLAMALAPVIFAITLGLALFWFRYQGRYFMFAFALAAVSWSLLLFNRPGFAWAAAAIAAVTLTLSLVNSQSKPSDVWTKPDWWTQSLLRGHSGDRTVLRIAEQRIPAHASIAIAARSNDFLSPYFGPDLTRHVSLVLAGGTADRCATWLIAAPGVRPADYARTWQATRRTRFGWLIAHRAAAAGCKKA